MDSIGKLFSSLGADIFGLSWVKKKKNHAESQQSTSLAHPIAGVIQTTGASPSEPIYPQTAPLMQATIIRKVLFDLRRVLRVGLLLFSNPQLKAES